MTDDLTDLKELRSIQRVTEEWLSGHKHTEESSGYQVALRLKALVDKMTKDIIKDAFTCVHGNYHQASCSFCNDSEKK